MIEDNIIEFENNDLNHILENKYDELLRNMKKEDYIIEYTSFYQFHELRCEGKTVGFFTLDTFMPSEIILCLNECYILPKYRGKDIFINIVKDYLENEKIRFYIRKPNKTFIRFLIKHSLAFEVAPDIITSHIKFITTGSETYSNKNIKRLYRKLNSETEQLIFYSAAFHMSLCSVFCIDPLLRIAKDANTLMVHNPRKEDLKKYSLRKKFKSLTVNKLFDIHYNYAINNDEIAEFNEKLSDELNENNDDILVIFNDDEVLVFENLKPNDAIRIEEDIKDNVIEGNLSFSTSEIRFEYLLNHPDKIGKSVEIKKGDEFDVCPFCGKTISSEEYCGTCGQLLGKMSMKSIFKDFIKNRLK